MRISDWSSDVCSSDLADVSFETALRARIKALPEVVSAASSVDWSVRPQGAFTSAIVLTVAYDPRGRTMTGWQGWIPTRVYIDVMAASAPVKATLRDAIRSEERRVGKECVSTCRTRGEPDHSKKKHRTTNKKK